MADPVPDPSLVPSTGVPDLDRALDSLYWGDNVVWELEEGAGIEPFYAAIVDTAAGYDLASFVVLEHDPDEIRARYPGLEVVDARKGTALDAPEPLLAEIRRRSHATHRDLVLFDSLEAMAARWGEDAALRFFTRTCPLLLEFGAIAYWALAPAEHPQATRREIEEVTQCVVAVGEGRLRVVKAEGRPAGMEGSVFRYRVREGRPELAAAPAAARLGAALRAVRINRGLSQSEIARLAGVSPSAVSQAERGQRGLSLETLLQLTGKLSITLDELLRGDVAPGYRLARRHEPHERAEGRVLPLLDNPAAGLRAYLVRVAPGDTVVPPAGHKGIELVAVASGLVQVLLASGRPVLRTGETLLAERTPIKGWRNLSESEAMVFWILRDETGAALPVRDRL